MWLISHVVRSRGPRRKATASRRLATCWSAATWFNTGLSPAWDEEPFARWLDGDNLCFCDTVGAAGGERFLSHPHMRCVRVSSGLTSQSYHRLADKVIANMEGYLAGKA